MVLVLVHECLTTHKKWAKSVSRAKSTGSLLQRHSLNIQNCKWGRQCKVIMLLIKKPNFWKSTTSFMTLTNDYAHAIVKQKETNTDYLRGRSVFVFIGNKLCPFEKRFHKLELRVSLGFPNTRKQWKHSTFGLVLSSALSCLEILMKHSPSFMKYYTFTVWSYHFSHESL